MDTVFIILSGVCLITGAFLGLTSAVGIIRMPDFYSRIHAVGITDTLAAFLILVGLALLATTWIEVAKLAMVFSFLAFTSPTATHALSKAAKHAGLQPYTRNGPAK
ncbi:MAG: monovalent cation/H(+) antiporter subunit G [Ketobacteraceae bacterium]|nr:monovalent cation/H(+) antiporter subunit G [Ketobacteraceae bacterium]